MTQAPPNASPLPDAVRGRRDRLVVAAMSLMYGWSFFQRVAVPGSLFAAIQSDMACSATAVTGLASLYLTIYAPGQFATAYLADRWGNARLIIIGSLLLSVGALAFPLSPGLGWLYACRALVALGATVMYLCAIRELASRFDALTFSKLVGPVMFMGGLGGLMGTFPTAWLASWPQLGWRGSLLVAGGLTSLSTVALLLLLRKGGPPLHAPPPITWSVGRGVLLSRRLRPIYIINPFVFATYFLFQAVVGPKYLQDVVGCSAVQASNITLAMQITSMIVMLSSGLASALFGHRRRPALMAQVGATLAAMLLLLAAIHLRLPLAVHAVGFLLMGIANGLMPLCVCATKESVPPPAVGIVLAVMNGTVYVVVALVSNLSGLVLDAFEATRLGDEMHYPPAAYSRLLLILLAPAALAVVASLVFREPEHAPTQID